MRDRSAKLTLAILTALTVLCLGMIVALARCPTVANYATVQNPTVKDYLTVQSSPSDIPDNWWSLQAVRACCSAADAVWADDWQILPNGNVLAKVTGGGPRNHAWAPINKVYEVPADRILKEPGNPTGRPLLFINQHSLHLYCFAMGPLI